MRGDLLLSALGVVVAVVTYLHSRSRERRLRRAELVRAYTGDFYGDPEVTAVFLAVDHGRYRLTDADLGTAAELALIHLLDILNIVGHNWKRGVLRLEDIVPTTIGYDAVRVYEDSAVQWYLKKVAGWDVERYCAGTGFAYFQALAKALRAACDGQRTGLLGRRRVDPPRPRRSRAAPPGAA
jgi:hypothetical protein